MTAPLAPPREASATLDSEPAACYPTGGGSSFTHTNPYAALADDSDTESDADTSTSPPWFTNQLHVNVFERVMKEMVRHHSKTWPATNLEAEPKSDAAITDSAAEVKLHLMHRWIRWHRTLRVASSPAWYNDKASALWGRISMHRLRFKGERKWYMVVATSDTQRRVLVLAAPPRLFPDDAARDRHAELQATYRDTRDNLFAPGMRIIPNLLSPLLCDEELRLGITEGFRSKHIYHPKQYTGRNYGAAKTHPELFETQLAKERGVYNEGPLHYIPHIVQPAGGVYYPEKAKFRILWNAKASGYNDSLHPAGGDFDGIDEVLRHYTPNCWQSGSDARDAFRHWAKEQVDCDNLGIFSPATQSYDRARYLIFGARDSPEIQGRMSQALKQLWTAHVPRLSSTPQGSFKAAGAWVDDYHNVHHGSLTLAEATRQHEAFVAFNLSIGHVLAEEKHVPPTKTKEYVGLLINSAEQWAGVTDKRAGKIIEEIEETLLDFDTLTDPDGLHLLDLQAGAGSTAHALFLAGHPVTSHWQVESSPSARTKAEDTSYALAEAFPGYATATLARDVNGITENHVRQLYNLNMLSFAALDARRDASATATATTALKILEWTQQHNPAVQYLFHCVTGDATTTALLSRALGPPCSGLYNRTYWTSWRVTRSSEPHHNKAESPHHTEELASIFAHFRRPTARPCHVNSSISRLRVASLTGKLQYCAKVVPGMQSHLVPLYHVRDAFLDNRTRDLSPKAQWGDDVAVKMSSAGLSSLRWCAEALAKRHRRRYYCTGSPDTTGFWCGKTASTADELASASHTTEGIPIIRTDASGTGGGAVHGDALRLAVPWTGNHAFLALDTVSSNYRELSMVCIALEEWGAHFRNSRVLVMCDNSVSVAVVHKQGSQTLPLNDLYWRLHQACENNNIDLALRHIKGVENCLADALSRYVRLKDHSDWQFDPAEFNAISNEVGQHDVDTGADPMGNNALTSRYWSALDDGASQPWEALRCWCNCDYLQLERYLKRHRLTNRNTGSSATFVIPYWPDKPWWRLIKGLRLLALYPTGTQLFTAPDWASLKNLDGSFSTDPKRRTINTTVWPVLILHSPPFDSGTNGGDKTGANRATGRLTDWRMLPEMSGDCGRDADILRTLQEIPMRQLYRNGPYAHRPGSGVLPLPTETRATVPNSQYTSKQGNVHSTRRRPTSDGERSSQRVNGSSPPQGTPRLHQLRLPARRSEPSGNTRAGGGVYNILAEPSRPATRLEHRGKLPSRRHGLAPADATVHTASSKPGPLEGGADAAQGRERQLQAAFQSEKGVDPLRSTEHAPARFHDGKKRPSPAPMLHHLHSGHHSPPRSGVLARVLRSDELADGDTGDFSPRLRHHHPSAVRTETVHFHPHRQGQERQSMETAHNGHSSLRHSAVHPPRGRARGISHHRSTAVGGFPLRSSAHWEKFSDFPHDTVHLLRTSIQTGVPSHVPSGRNWHRNGVRRDFVPKIHGAMALGRRLGQTSHR